MPLVHILRFDTKADLLINLIGNFATLIPTGVMTPLIYKNINTFRKIGCEPYICTNGETGTAEQMTNRVVCRSLKKMCIFQKSASPTAAKSFTMTQKRHAFACLFLI